MKHNGTSLLLVEDDANQRQLLTGLLQGAQFEVTAVDGVESAIVALKANPQLQLVFSDWQLAGRDGLELLRWVRRERPTLGFVVGTAYGSVSHAVEAIQAGADDYLTKPFKRQEMLLAIEKARRAAALRQQNQQLQQALGEQQQLVELIGAAPCMQQLFARINRISHADVPVLISGESGTGKELAARALHQLSPRRDGPFVALNCGAIPESLAEAELFGAEKGAYTGAVASKAGKFEAAQDGSLFLDEIAELPLPLQAKLLRVLQEGKVTRLGSHHEIQLNVRIIAASHQDLAQAVRDGRFREDLYYRLNVVPLHMPALRERGDDIPVLINHYLQKYQQRYQTSAPALSKAALKQLLSYRWPGNVRELANRLERFVLLQDETELLAGLQPQNATNATQASGDFVLPSQGLSFEALEKSCLQQALQLAQGNKSQAARLLELPYKAFLYRLEKFGLAD